MCCDTYQRDGGCREPKLVLCSTILMAMGGSKSSHTAGSGWMNGQLTTTTPNVMKKVHYCLA
jgi:hypothetical protein